MSVRQPASLVHLEQGVEEYLETINRPSEEAIQKRAERLSVLGEQVERDTQDILCVGVGSGHDLAAAHINFPDARLIGVDVSPKVCAIAEKNLEQQRVPAKVRVANAVELPFRPESFDAVLLSAVLHEVYSYEDQPDRAYCHAVREAARVLRPGGALYVLEYAAPTIGAAELRLRTKRSREFLAQYQRGYQGQYDAHTLTGTKEIAEFLLHLGHFELRPGLQEPDEVDESWKEFQETYLVQTDSTVEELVGGSIELTLVEDWVAKRVVQAIESHVTVVNSTTRMPVSLESLCRIQHAIYAKRHERSR